MTILDRYIARSFVSGYLILITVAIGLYVFSDMLVNIDEFTKDDTAPLTTVFSLMFDFYIHNIPLYFKQLGGPIMAIAGAFTIGTLLRNNELTAVVAAGVPLQRIAAPLALTAVVLIGVWVANNELLIPRIANKIARTHADLLATRVEGIDAVRDANNAILSAVEFYPRRGELRHVFIVTPDESGAPRDLVMADMAEYDAAEQTWRLARGIQMRMYSPLTGMGLGPELDRTPLDTYPYLLSPDELVLRRESTWAHLLSFQQINELLKSRHLANRATIEMSRHVRLTEPITILILVLLVVPHFLNRLPGNVLAAGARALIVAGAFYVVTFVAHSVGAAEEYAALIAWLPILCFGPVAVVQLADTQT